MIFDNIFLILFIISGAFFLQDYTNSATSYQPLLSDILLIGILSLILIIMGIFTIVLTYQNISNLI